jgi:hypothetical protein
LPLRKKKTKQEARGKIEVTSLKIIAAVAATAVVTACKN